MLSIEKQLTQILNSDFGEREIHNFLKRNSYLVEMAFNRAWNFHVCIPEFKLGDEYRADFLVLSAHSGHWYAIFIELKDFNTHLYTKDGIPTQSFRQAQKQINDYRDWTRVNEPYLRRRFASILEKEDAPAIFPNAIPNYTKGYSSGATEIADMKSFVDYYYHIVIGRSSTLTSEERMRRQKDMTWGGAEVATYDRFITMARRADKANKSMA